MDGIRRITVNGVDWRLREDAADVLLASGALDVWKLAEHPSAKLVKKGVHRIVFRVSLPRGDDEDDTLDLYVKVFLFPRARDILRYMVRASHGWREWRAGEALERIGIATAPRVAVGVRRTGGVLRDDVLITEAVENVVPLDRFVREELPKMPPDERGRFIRTAAPVLAAFVRRLHDGGIRHRDFHAGNVLLKTTPEGARQLMLIDLHTVSRNAPLALGVRLRNLTRFNRFFSMLLGRTARLRFWNAYVEGMPFLEAHRLEYARLLEAHTARSCRAFWRKRERRCLGTNREFRRFRRNGVVGHTVRGRIELPDNTLDRLPAGGMTMPDADVIKASTTTRIWEQRIDFGSQTRSVVVKRKDRRTGGPWRVLRTFLRHVGAMREWRMAYALKLRGLPAVEMLAAFERRRLGVLYESVLVMSKVENAENLVLFVNRTFTGELTRDTARLRRRMTRTLGRLVARLHRLGFTQRDLKPSNILVTVSDGPEADVAFTLIDFEGMRHRGKVSESRRVRDLARLASEFADSPAVRDVDRMRFLEAYLLGRSVSAEQRRAWAAAIGHETAKRLKR